MIVGLDADIRQLIAQEETLRFAAFNEADAWALGSAMRERAAAAQLPLVIHIQVAGRQLFYTALPGTTDDNREWVRRKINGVMRYHKSSYRIGRELALSGKALDLGRGVAPGEIAPHGGCFPIHIKGTGVVGTVTVSGIPQREDHTFVVESIAAFLGLDFAPLALASED